MQDDFLQAFAERRKLRAEQDRSFDLEGVILTHRAAIAPEVALRFQESHEEMARWATEVDQLLATANGSTSPIPDQPISEAELLTVYDELILSCLEESSHASWAKLRSPSAPYPLAGSDIYALVVYLIGKTTELPTVGLPDSSSPQPETGTTSKESSRSPARKRKASAPS